MTWYLHWKKVTNKYLKHVKVFDKGLIRRIGSQGKCYYCLTFAELGTFQDQEKIHM